MLGEWLEGVEERVNLAQRVQSLGRKLTRDFRAKYFADQVFTAHLSGEGLKEKRRPQLRPPFLLKKRPPRKTIRGANIAPRKAAATVYCF